MRLNIADRLALAALLPSEGNVVTMRLVADLRNRLLFNDVEMESLGMVQQGTSVFWDKEKDYDKEVEIGAATKGIIVEALKRLNDTNKITVNHLSLYERFVETASPPENDG